MWKFIAARPSVASNLGQKLLSLQNSPLQVVYKPLNSSSWVSNFLSSVYPAKFIHQNHRFFSQSSNGWAFGETPVNCDAQMGSIVSVEEQLEGEINVNFTAATETNCSKWDDALDLLKNNVDESLESTLDSMDLCLDEEFVLRLLKNTFFPEKHLIRFFKWVCSKKEFRVTTSILEHLGYRIRNFHDIIDAYALWELVKEMGEKDNGLLNAKILNDFLVAFYCLRNVKITLEVYGKFEEFGCIPDGETYYRTINTLWEQFAYEQAIPVCQKMLDTGMLSQKGVFDLISLLCKDDKAKEARTVYIAAKKTNKYSHSFLVRSLSEVVDCLTKVDETVHLATELLLFGHHTSFDYWESSDIIDNQFLLVVRGLCRINDIQGAKKLLFEMVKKGPHPLSKVFDCLIECLSKAGDLEDATEIFEIAKRREEPNKILEDAHEVLICSYAKVGLMEDACKIFLAAKQKFPKFYPFGLQVLIEGYCKVGEFEKALKLFLDFGVIPNVDEDNELIQSLSLCLNNLDQGIAQKFLEEMRKKGLYLPHITESLVRASTVLT